MHANYCGGCTLRCISSWPWTSFIFSIFSNGLSLKHGLCGMFEFECWVNKNSLPPFHLMASDKPKQAKSIYWTMVSMTIIALSTCCESLQRNIPATFRNSDTGILSSVKGRIGGSSPVWSIRPRSLLCCLSVFLSQMPPRISWPVVDPRRPKSVTAPWSMRTHGPTVQSVA